MPAIGIFLDRDGTINDEVDFLTNPDELHLIDGSAEAIAEANKLGCKVVVITNQSGVARGFLTEQRLKSIHEALETSLQRHNARVDAIYYCPHHPTLGNAPYRKDCDCRKPKTGMLDRAAKKFGIDLKESFVIGDRLLDMQTAQAAGATSILVLTGYGREELELCRIHGIQIDHVAADLREAMRHVKQSIRENQPQ
jgi:D-glycero-D-manno-heptose 1,7-bisphosphate phosphatase